MPLANKRGLYGALFLALLLVGCGKSTHNTKRLANGLVDDREIHLSNSLDVSTMRKRLIGFVWGTKRLPDNVPTDIEEDVSSPFPDIQHLKQVDRITIQMDLGFTSMAYLFHPNTPKNTLAIFHQGHSDDLGAYGAEATIRSLVAEGYTVLTLMMPLLGENEHVVPRHDDIFLLTQLELTYHPMKFFVEPVVVALNYLQEKYAFDHTTMMGISGGGWTTVVAAAIDPRITLSIPIAGSLPLYLRTEQRDIGDREQYEESFYQIAGYPDLYVLGASGERRRQIQVLNRYDSCCFGGLRYREYEERIQRALQVIGEGQFRVVLDESHKDHLISPYALKEYILPTIRAE